MSKMRSLDVYCKCGFHLARYKKGGKGRLVKMFFHKILADHAGVFLTEPPLPLNQDIYCPQCGDRVASVRLVSGKHAAKINQGVVRY